MTRPRSPRTTDDRAAGSGSSGAAGTSRGGAGQPGPADRESTPPLGPGRQHPEYGPAAPASPGPWDPHSQALLADGAMGAAKEPRLRSARFGGRVGARRGSADPVKALLHRHRELCERAVDPLEIAAGLEAHGVTDRTAARLRHRDVFSLAEELYARVPRAEVHPRVAQDDPVRGAAGSVRRAALYLLPGAFCLAAVATAQPAVVDDAALRLGGGALGTAAAALALRFCLRSGSLSVCRGAMGAAPLWTCWLLAQLLFGDALLEHLLPAGPDGHVPGSHLPAAPAAIALAFAVGPAAWCARWFATRARRRLAASRGPGDFSAGARPLPLTATALFLTMLVALLLAVRTGDAYLGDGPYGDWYERWYGGWYGGWYGTGSLAAAAALGTLLFVARLLAVHDRGSAAAKGLATACAVEVALLGTAMAARLPGCAALDGPIEAAVAAYGPGVVSLAACAAVVPVLLAHAMVVLSRASAHPFPPAEPR
ncbi:hypothetical protein [Streptomyces sp. KR80]|uniref:hypothetical protein n=1 Tax=Streptomyces sp. KR80 TaxID=3457426 RepID=UPI003FCEF7C6